jgi:hypothetical protein
MSPDCTIYSPNQRVNRTGQGGGRKLVICGFHFSDKMIAEGKIVQPVTRRPLGSFIREIVLRGSYEI